MSHEIAAAAFIRGAACSSAAEARKATLRFPAHLGIKYHRSRKHQYPSIRSASPAEVAQRRRSIVTSASLPECASGCTRLENSCTIVPNFRSANARYSPRFLAVAPCGGKKAWTKDEGAHFNRSTTCMRADATLSFYFSLYPVKSRRRLSTNSSPGTTTGPGKGVPNLGRLAKTSFLILILQKTGNLVSPPPPKADKNKAALNLALLSVGLLIGYVASKDGSKLATVLKTCDGTMKFYKVVTEIADILSTFFK